VGAIFAPIIYAFAVGFKFFIADVTLKRNVGDSTLTKIGFFIFIFNFFLLGILGGSPIEEPYYTLSQISTALYFFY